MLSRVQLFCSPMDCTLPGSSIHRILQARVLKRCHFLLRGSSQPRDQTHVSCLAGGFFTTEPPRKPDITYMWNLKHNTNLPMKQNQTHKHGEQTWGYRGGGMDWEPGMDWVLYRRTLFIRPIFNSLHVLNPNSYLVLLSLGGIQVGFMSLLSWWSGRPYD